MPPKKVHDIVKSVTDTEATEYFERLENRFRSHLNLLDESLTQLFCKCCNVSFLKTVHEIKKHLITDAHKSKALVANKKYNFFCNVCNVICSKEMSWQEHLNHTLHMSK